MLKIDVSTHPESADKIVRFVIDADNVFFVSMPEWARALAHVGQFSPDVPRALRLLPAEWADGNLTRRNREHEIGNFRT